VEKRVHNMLALSVSWNGSTRSCLSAARAYALPQ